MFSVPRLSSQLEPTSICACIAIGNHISGAEMISVP
jgi:hypothetical protein